jgi:hypothetical protein
MGLANLLNLPVTPELINAFSFANQDSHQKIAAAILKKFDKTVPLYPLDPIPPTQEGLLDWGLNHQAAHSAQNDILNIQGQDISEVNFENEEQLASWIQEHFVEHYLAETQLGVT